MDEFYIYQIHSLTEYLNFYSSLPFGYYYNTGALVQPHTAASLAVDPF